MKKILCIILASMMLVLCGCGSDDSSAVSVSSEAGSVKESFSKEFSKFGLTLYLPEDAYESENEDQDFGSSTRYFCERGYIMLSKLSLKIDNWHNGVLRDSFLSFVNDSSGSIQNVTFNDTNAAIYDMSLMKDSKEYTVRGIVFNLSGNSMQIAVTSYRSKDDTKQFFEDIISKMTADGNPVRITTSFSNSTEESKDGNGIFVKKKYYGGFSFCVPADAVEKTSSGGNKTYDGTEAVIIVAESSYIPDLTDDLEIYEIYNTYDIERKTVDGTTVVKIITTSEGKNYGWVLFTYLGTYYTVGVTSKIDAVSYTNVKKLLDDFFVTLNL